MADDAAATQGAGTPTTSVIVPEEIRNQFTELVDLVLRSESMNDEERQYWINILPIMTPEQTQNLRDILDNERKQLAAIDEKYAKDIGKVGESDALRQISAERGRKRDERKKAEESVKSDEMSAAEALFDNLNNA